MPRTIDPSSAAPAPHGGSSLPWELAPPPVPPWRGRVTRALLVVVPVAVLGVGLASLAALGQVRSGGTTTGRGTPAALPATSAAGVLTATGGDTWTVRTASGVVAVDLRPHTRFGSTAHPVDESAFHSGEQVRVSGRGTGTTIVASHVVAAPTTTSPRS